MGLNNPHNGVVKEFVWDKHKGKNDKLLDTPLFCCVVLCAFHFSYFTSNALEFLF